MILVDIVEAVSGPDRRRALEAIRDRIAAELAPTEHVAGCECECGPPPASGRDVATLAKELRAVIDAINGLPEVEEGNPLDRITASVADELAPRREARQSASAAP